MTEKLKIGIASCASSDINFLQSRISKLENVGVIKVLFDLKETNEIAKEELDLVVICDCLLDGVNFKYLREITTHTKIILCFQKDVTTLAGGFNLYTTLHVSDVDAHVEHAILSTMKNGISFGASKGKAYINPRQNFFSPSEMGLTPLNMFHLDSYAVCESIQEAAVECKISLGAFNSDLDVICKKLGLTSRKQIVPFLCLAHWCCLDGRFRWF